MKRRRASRGRATPTRLRERARGRHRRAAFRSSHAGDSRRLPRPRRPACARGIDSQRARPRSRRRDREKDRRSARGPRARSSASPRAAPHSGRVATDSRRIARNENSGDRPDQGSPRRSGRSSPVGCPSVCAGRRARPGRREHRPRRRRRAPRPSGRSRRRRTRARSHRRSPGSRAGVRTLRIPISPSLRRSRGHPSASCDSAVRGGFSSRGSRPATSTAASGRLNR